MGLCEEGTNRVNEVEMMMCRVNWVERDDAQGRLVRSESAKLQAKCYSCDLLCL